MITDRELANCLLEYTLHMKEHGGEIYRPRMTETFLSVDELKEVTRRNLEREFFTELEEPREQGSVYNTVDLNSNPGIIISNCEDEFEILRRDPELEPQTAGEGPASSFALIDKFDKCQEQHHKSQLKEYEEKLKGVIESNRSEDAELYKDIDRLARQRKQQKDKGDEALKNALAEKKESMDKRKEEKKRKRSPRKENPKKNPKKKKSEDDTQPGTCQEGEVEIPEKDEVEVSGYNDATIAGDPLIERSKKGECNVFPTPLNALRYLSALKKVHPRECISTELRGVNPPKLYEDSLIKLVIGPPGCGKTHFIVNKLKELLNSNSNEGKFFIGGATNVGVAQLYARCRDEGIFGSLIMHRNKIPPGTVKLGRSETCTWSADDRLIFATTSTRFGSKLRSKKFQYIILDEAAQICESETIPLFRSEVEQITLVGDPKQLSAVVSREGHLLGYDKSLMQRLLGNGHPRMMLDTQYRSHPDIYRFSNEQFYNGVVKNANTVVAMDSVREPLKTTLVCGEPQRDGTSYNNKAEVMALWNDILALWKSGELKGRSIAILTPYKGQKLLFEGKLAKKGPKMGIVVNTITESQGSEFDCVFLSTVRDSPFWSAPLINVAMTRARSMMRIYGGNSGWWVEI